MRPIFLTPRGREHIICVRAQAFVTFYLQSTTSHSSLTAYTPLPTYSIPLLPIHTPHAIPHIPHPTPLHTTHSIHPFTFHNLTTAWAGTHNMCSRPGFCHFPFAVHRISQLQLQQSFFYSQPHLSTKSAKVGFDTLPSPCVQYSLHRVGGNT